MCSKSLSSRVHKFSKHPRAISKAQGREGCHEASSILRTRKFRRHRTKFSRPGDLTPWISAPLPTVCTFLNVRGHVPHPYTKQAKLQ
jgi:hypothetical protein